MLGDVGRQTPICIRDVVQPGTPSGMLRLPRRPLEYLKSPLATWQKLSTWLNARWQLRQCNQVGQWARVRGRIFIRNGGYIVFGDQVQVLSDCAHSVFAAISGGTLVVGDRTFINYGVDIAATRLVQIGSDCLIGTHVIILDNDFHVVTDRTRIPEGKPVIIGDNVWLGNRVTILPGVTIGEGAVVGAGSVVTSNVPPRSIVAGNPARVIKHI